MMMFSTLVSSITSVVLLLPFLVAVLVAGYSFLAWILELVRIGHREILILSLKRELYMKNSLTKTNDEPIRSQPRKDDSTFPFDDFH